MIDRSGFTLVELLAALVIASGVVAAVYQLVAGHGRLIEIQSAREEIQQNARATIELITSELRAIPPGNGIVRAAADSITIRVPRIWGAVCDTDGGTWIDAIFPAIDRPDFGTNRGTGIVVNLGTRESPVWSSGIGLIEIGGRSSECGGRPVGIGAERRSLTLAGHVSNGGPLPEVGGVLYIYEQVTYRTGRSAGLPGLWIQRRIGDGPGTTNQPMAGPINPDAGFEFRYFAGGVPVTSPILNDSVRANVDRILMTVNAISGRTIGDMHQSKTETAVISLRNRIQ